MVIWVPLALIGVVGLGAVAALLLIRSMQGREPLSPEERREMAGVPMPLLQKRALWNLLIGVATLGTIAAILSNRGAAAYWEDDDLRLMVVGIFMAGLLAWVAVLGVTVGAGLGKRLDERDRAILARAPTAQSALVLIALAVWLISLTERYHEQQAVPVVYLYLMFGSIVLVSLIGQSLGILLGYWFKVGHGEG